MHKSKKLHKIALCGRQLFSLNIDVFFPICFISHCHSYRLWKVMGIMIIRSIWLKVWFSRVRDWRLNYIGFHIGLCVFYKVLISHWLSILLYCVLLWFDLIVTMAPTCWRTVLVVENSGHFLLQVPLIPWILDDTVNVWIISGSAPLFLVACVVRNSGHRENDYFEHVARSHTL